MWDRLFGVQLGFWALVQTVLMAGAILVIGWILSKIDLETPAPGGSTTEREER